MVCESLNHIELLIESFNRGNVIRNGVRTVIAGKPNAGKSTLLNALLKEEKAIVSDIPGTTRDVIEDVVHVGGITLRFLDTAGLRDTTDPIEAIGVSRTVEQMKIASFVLYLVDAGGGKIADFESEIDKVKAYGISVLPVANKINKASPEMVAELERRGFVCISARSGLYLEKLQSRLIEMFGNMAVRPGETVVTNARHYAGLLSTRESLQRVIEALDKKVTGNFLAQDLRLALHHLGELTGTITTEDLLEQIFSKFCIGK